MWIAYCAAIYVTVVVSVFTIAFICDDSIETEVTVLLRQFAGTAFYTSSNALVAH